MNAWLKFLLLAGVLVALAYSHIWIYDKGHEHGQAFAGPIAFRQGKAKQFSIMHFYMKQACIDSKAFLIDGQKYICAPTISL